MKKIIQIGIVVVMLIGCEPEVKYRDDDQKKVAMATGWGNLAEGPYSSYETVVIDGCEYLVGWVGDSRGGPIMTHKGNCKYCKQRNTPVKQ